MGEGAAVVAEELVAADEIDAVLAYGFGQISLVGSEPDPNAAYQAEENVLKRICDLIPRYGKPILVGSYFSEGESPPIDTITKQGYRVYHDVEDAATILASLYQYYSRLTS